MKVLEWPSQSLMNPIENLWKELKIAVHQHFQFNLTELEQISKEEWEKIPKSRCVKLIQRYPRTLEAVIAATVKALLQSIYSLGLIRIDAKHFDFSFLINL